MEKQMLAFSTDLYRLLVAEGPTENVFVSPTSILTVLYMVFIGADGNTADQMAITMKVQDISKDDLKSAMNKMMKTFKLESKDYQLSVANKLFPHVDKTILEEFIKQVATTFHTETSAMDFSKNPEGCRQEINAWVEKETNTKIKNLIGSGVITPLTAMVLVNAIYFKGDWEDKFKQENTRKEQFILTDGKAVSVDMMHKRYKKALYFESEELSCQILQLPYKGGEISMVLILPRAHDGLAALEKQLCGQVIQGLIANLGKVMVEVALPKFKVESSYQLVGLLSKLGMPDLFDEKKADLSKMSKEQLHVSHVIHKAFVEVNEEGSEAAAATAAVVMKRSIPIVMQFMAKHPFMYMIWDNRVNVPLFMGRMVAPQNSGVTQKEEL